MPHAATTWEKKRTEEIYINDSIVNDERATCIPNRNHNIQDPTNVYLSLRINFVHLSLSLSIFLSLIFALSLYLDLYLSLSFSL